MEAGGIEGDRERKKPDGWREGGSAGMRISISHRNSLLLSLLLL